MRFDKYIETIQGSRNQSSLHFPNIYDPRDYGASPTASRPTNRDAIQQALDDAFNNGGGTVRLYELYPVTAGTPTAPTPITIRKNVILEGIGPKSGLQFDSVDNVNCIVLRDFPNFKGIRNMKLTNSNWTNTFHNQVMIYNGDPNISEEINNSFIKDMIFENVGIGIKLVNPAQNIYYENIRMSYVTNIGLWCLGDGTGTGLSNPGNTLVNGLGVSFTNANNIGRISANPRCILFEKKGNGNGWSRVTMTNLQLYYPSGNGSGPLSGSAAIELRTDSTNPKSVCESVSIIDANIEELEYGVIFNTYSQFNAISFENLHFAWRNGGGFKVNQSNDKLFITINGLYASDTGILRGTKQYALFEGINWMKVAINGYTHVYYGGSDTFRFAKKGDGSDANLYHPNFINNYWYYGKNEWFTSWNGKRIQQQGKKEDAPGGSTTTKQVNFTIPENDTNYQVIVTPLGNARVWVTNKSTTGFTLNYDVAGGVDVDWVVVRS